MLYWMPKWRKVDIFVASTGEVRELRDALGVVVTDLNGTLGRQQQAVIELIRWETHARPSVGRPQAVINRQIDAYDLFVGILWKRFGTPTGLAESGTEEEFRIAWERYGQGSISDVLFYFSEQPWWPTAEAELDQFRSMLRFRREVESRTLAWRFAGRAEFEALARKHLYDAVDALLTRPADDPRSMRFEPELGRLLEQTRREAMASGIALRTPSLMLTLLRMPGSLALQCMEAVSPEFGATLSRSLEAYLVSAEAKAGTDRMRDWHERPEMVAAWTEARRNGRMQITVGDLLVALLRSSSKTIVELREHLGSSFSLVMQRAELLARQPQAEEQTPGKIFKEDR
jgi:hypothetical protein